MWDLPLLSLNHFWLLVGISPGLPTHLLVVQPLPLPRVCWLHHSPFPNKITCLVSYLSSFLFHPNGKGLSYLTTYLYGMYQVVLAHTYLFWVKSHPSRTFPQRSLGGNSIIDPVFLPIAKPHPLNTLTRGPPPMYWLGTSRWCLGPLCTLYSVCDCFFLAFTSLLLLFRWLVFLCILACVYPLWHGGFLGSCFLFPGWVLSR